MELRCNIGDGDIIIIILLLKDFAAKIFVE